MKQLLIVSLALVLAACGGGQPPEQLREQRAQPAPTVAVIAPNFGDADPHDWDNGSPWAHPVHGIDVSRYQTRINWAEARQNGVNFTFIKATEGGDGLDPMFAQHWQGARAAGIPRGAYHFFYHCRPAAEQARWFIRHVPREAGALPPVLDMEWTPTSPTCRTRRDAETIRREARIFMDAIAAHYGQRPILYTTVDFFEDNQMWRLGNLDFWLRSVSAHPKDRYAGQAWTFWQYSGTGTVPGIAGRVDLNAFAGSTRAWNQWLAARVLGAYSP